MPKRTSKRRTRGGGFFDFLTGKRDQTQMYGQTPSQSSFPSLFQRRQPQQQVQSIAPSYSDGQNNGYFGGRRRKTRKTRKGRKMRTRKNR